jgi:nucleotide-binding universal stress UspA family protein
MGEPSAAKVIVGVDGSGESADALALALTLSKALGARLWPVFVHPYGPLSRTLPESSYEELVNELADSVHAQLKALELAPRERTLQIVTDRSPAAGLQRIAEQEAAALIVVGGSRRSRVGRVLPGGSAERLLAGAPCPVAIAPKGYADDRGELASVGTAFDGSEESRAALRWAAELSRSVNARLCLVGVHVPLPPVTLEDGSGVQLTSVNEGLRDELRQQLAEAEASARDGEMEVASTLLDGNAAGQLAQASERLDLLVVGSRGYGPLGAVVLGSVSNALVRTARCPLVVLPRSVKS